MGSSPQALGGHADVWTVADENTRTLSKSFPQNGGSFGFVLWKDHPDCKGNSGAQGETEAGRQQLWGGLESTAFSH